MIHIRGEGVGVKVFLPCNDIFILFASNKTDLLMSIRF